MANPIQEPVTLKIGAKYKLETKNDITHQTTYEDILFCSYTSSPEIIIVKINTGQRRRVARYNIYEAYEKN